MSDYLQTLAIINESIEKLEEDHNSILDTQTHLNNEVHDLDADVQKEVTRIKQDIVVIRRAIHERINKAKRATVILSLLAQGEELRRIQARIKKQPYEYYATSQWFASILQDRTSSSKSDL